jgi:hypothetical protein
MKTIVSITMYIAFFFMVLHGLYILVLAFEGETIYSADCFRFLTPTFYYALALIAKKSFDD